MPGDLVDRYRSSKFGVNSVRGARKMMSTDERGPAGRSRHDSAKKKKKKELPVVKMD